jgi:hypothetical protein
MSELLYGSGEPQIDVIRSHTQHVKKKLRAPWKIISMYGTGYMLIRTDSRALDGLRPKSANSGVD